MIFNHDLPHLTYVRNYYIVFGSSIPNNKLLVIAWMAWYRRRHDCNTGVQFGTCLCLSSVSIIKNLQHLITLVGMYCQVSCIIKQIRPKKTRYIDYIIYTRSHSHLLDMISNRHSDHLFPICAFGAVAVQIKTSPQKYLYLRTGDPLNLQLWFSLTPQFWQRRIWVKITCNCPDGGNCPDHNVKLMGASITCHALPGVTKALKACLSNVLSTILPYGTIFGSVSAFSLEKSLKDIHAYILTYKHINV